MSSVVQVPGYGSAMCYMAKNFVMALDLGQSKAVLDDGLKDFMDNDVVAIFAGTFVVARLLIYEVHESKNTLSEFMDISDTNYKFMNQKMHFQSLWTYIFKVYGPKSFSGGPLV